MKIQSKKGFKKVLSKMIDSTPNGSNLDGYSFVIGEAFDFNIKTYKGFDLHRINYVEVRKIYLMKFNLKDFYYTEI